MSEENKPLEKTGDLLESITKNPPEPMLSPEKRAEIPRLNPENSEPRKIEPKDFSRLKDYKGRSFDPTIHEVGLDGVPVLNGDGSLKIMRGKNSPAREVVERITQRIFPKSDHQLNEENQERAQAQALAIADHSDRRISAENSAEVYFACGSVLLGPAFLNGSRQRKPRIVSQFEAYEIATGKSFDPPPWMALAIGLGSDVRETIEREKDCKERISGFFSGVKAGIAGMIAEKKLSGFFSRFRRKSKTEQPAAEAE